MGSIIYWGQVRKGKIIADPLANMDAVAEIDKAVQIRGYDFIRQRERIAGERGDWLTLGIGETCDLIHYHAGRITSGARRDLKKRHPDIHP